MLDSGSGVAGPDSFEDEPFVSTSASTIATTTSTIRPSAPPITAGDALRPCGAANRWARDGLLPLAPRLLAARHRSLTVTADGAGKAASSRKAKQSAKPVSASTGIVT